jgi:hypothetical protein
MNLSSFWRNTHLRLKLDGFDSLVGVNLHVSQNGDDLSQEHLGIGQGTNGMLNCKVAFRCRAVAERSEAWGLAVLAFPLLCLPEIALPSIATYK